MAIFSLTGVLESAASRVLQMPLEFGDSYDGFARPTLATRTSRSAIITRSEETQSLFAELTEVIHFANRPFGFVIDGIEDSANVVQYEVGGELDWHTDTHEDAKANSARKISVSVQLSEPSSYIGGDLEFAAHPSDAFSRVFGTAIVFPSYAAHRVRRVTEGRRLSLVVFARGPQFK